MIPRLPAHDEQWKTEGAFRAVATHGREYLVSAWRPWPRRRSCGRRCAEELRRKARRAYADQHDRRGGP